MQENNGVPSYMAKLAPYLDIHLNILISDYFIENPLISNDSALKYTIDLVKKTRMSSYLIELNKKLPSDTFDETDLVEAQEKDSALLKEMSNNLEYVLSAIQSPQFEDLLEIYSGDMDTITEKVITDFKFPPDFLTTIYEYSCLLYDTGNYEKSEEIISVYRRLVPRKSENALVALWGDLACRILLSETRQMVMLLEELETILELQINLPKSKQFNNQAHFMHWCLFAYLKIPQLIERIPFFFLRTQTCRFTLETICPHLLRYLVIAVVVSSSNKDDLNSLVDLIQQESYQYKDCFTLFIQLLLCEYDISGCLKYIKECYHEMSIDFFTNELRDHFQNEAYALVFKIYTQAHISVSGRSVAKLFDIDIELAQKLISEYYKIEYNETDAVINNTETSQPIYETILTRGNGLTDQCINSIIPNLERKPNSFGENEKKTRKTINES